MNTKTVLKAMIKEATKTLDQTTWRTPYFTQQILSLGKQGMRLALHASRLKHPRLYSPFDSLSMGISNSVKLYHKDSNAAF
jgi:hypothetical protein